MRPDLESWAYAVATILAIQFVAVVHGKKATCGGAVPVTTVKGIYVLELGLEMTQGFMASVTDDSDILSRFPSLHCRLDGF